MLSRVRAVLCACALMTTVIFPYLPEPAAGRSARADPEVGWSVDVASPLTWHSLGTVRREGVMVATRTGFTAFDTSSGSRLWHYARDDMTLAGWTYSGGWIVADYTRPGISAPFHTLVGLAAATGRPRWQRVDLAAAGSWQGDLERQGPHTVLTWSPREAQLSAIDSATGRTVWSRPGSQGCVPALSGQGDGAALVVERCAESIGFAALNPRTGRTTWSRRIPGRHSVTLTLARGVIGLLVDQQITAYDTSGREIVSRGDCALGCSLVRAGQRMILSYRVGGENVIEAISLADGRSWWRQSGRIARSSVPYRKLLVSGRFVYGVTAGGTSSTVLDAVELTTGRAKSITLPTSGVPVAYGGALYVEEKIARAGETTAARITRLTGMLDGEGVDEAQDGIVPDWPAICTILRPDVLTLSPLKRPINGLMVPAPNNCTFRNIHGAVFGAEIAAVASAEQQAISTMEELGKSGSWRPVRGVGDQALADASRLQTLIVRVGRTIITLRMDGPRPDQRLQLFAQEVAESVARESSVFETYSAKAPAATRTVRIAGAQITVHEGSDDPVHLVGYVPSDGVLRVRTSSDGGEVRKVSGGSAVSPDGRTVATTSDAYLTKGRDPVTITDLASGRVRKVLTVPVPRTVYSPEWSRDGSKILFTVRQMYGKKERTHGFAIIDLATLTSREVKMDDPDASYIWGGDGSTIAKALRRGFIRYRVDGTELNRLDKTGFSVMWDEEWLSPSGTRFTTWCPDDNTEICVRDVRDGFLLARIPYDAPGLVAWYDEYHLISWRHSQKKAPHRAVVIDFHGRVVKTIAEVGTADYAKGEVHLIFRPRPTAETARAAG